MSINDWPRVNLNHWPTPLEKMPRYGQLCGHQKLYIKRDDVMSLGLGGNKVRSLEFWLGAAEAKKADVILAAGMLQSNQCRLTAAAAIKLGLKCVLLHNNQKPQNYQGNTLLNHLMGVESIYLGDIDEKTRNEKVLAFAEHLKTQGQNPYIIGDQPLGALGYVNAAFELQTQIKQKDLAIKHVVLVGAMGTTAAGFVFGTALLNKPFMVHVISVEYNKEVLTKEILRIYEAIEKLVPIKPSISAQNTMEVYDDFLGPGYAMVTTESIQAIYDLAATEGIFLDTVYTSKTLWGMRELIANGVLKKDEGIVFIHTGGLPTLFAETNRFQP